MECGGYRLVDRRQRHYLQTLAVKFFCNHQNVGPSSANSVAARVFCSSQISSDKTNQYKGSSDPSVGLRDSGIYQLTQLFGKFLRSGEDRKAAELMNEMRSLDSKKAVVVCNYLLNSCSRSGNSEMAKDVWSFMKGSGVQMNKVSFGSMLCALTRGGRLDEAVDLLHILYKKKLANVVMYNTVLNGCVHAKSKMYAARCVQLMEAQGVSKDELTYIELIKLSGTQGDIDAARKWWAQLLQNFAPSPLIRAPYIVALSRMNALTEAREELRKLVADVGVQAQALKFEGNSMDQASRGEASPGKERVNSERLQVVCTKQDEVGVGSSQSRRSHNLVGGGEIRSRLHSEQLSKKDPLAKGPATDIPVLSTDLASLGARTPKRRVAVLKNLQVAYNSLINAAGKTGDYRLVETLFDEMRTLGLKTDIYTHNALVRAVVDERGVQPALQIVRNMESFGLQPDVHSFTALLEGYCRTQQLSKAEDVLNYMEHGRRNQWPTCHTFNILLNACAAQGDSCRALQVFGRMKETGVMPDGCTYLSLLSACGHVKGGGREGSDMWPGQEVVRRVTAIELDMAQCGVHHTPESLTTVLNVLGAEGLTEEMLQRLEDADNDILDVTSYNTVILNCLNAKQIETGWEIYHQMKSSGVKADVYTYNILINGCAQDKSVSTALMLVNTMRDEGLIPDVVTCNSLLKVVCHSGQMDAVPELLQKMAADGVQYDSTTFNTILTSASYQKRVDIMEHVVEEMRRRQVMPDLHTLLPVITTYMRVGQFDDAVEALRVLSLRMLDGKDHLQQQLSETSHPTSAGPTLDEDSNLRSDGSIDEPDRAKSTRELLMNAVLHATPDSIANYTAVLAGSIVEGGGSSRLEHSSWTTRLSRQYDRRGPFFRSNTL